MKIALCQIDTTVGDLRGNAERVRTAVAQAARDGAALCLFPELTLTGYPPRDLLDRPHFVQACAEHLQRLATELSDGPAVLLGYAAADPVAAERRLLSNAAALLAEGEVKQVFHKRLLPAYDVFDELRYFAPGQGASCFDLQGTRFGVLICEDAWNEADSPLRVEYADNPVQRCVDEGAEVLINLAASPFTLSKRTTRTEMLAQVARGRKLPLCFVNLVGGNDDILFDGGSALYGPSGEQLACAASFKEQVLSVDLEAGGALAAPPESDAAAALDALVMGVRDYAAKCGFPRGVLGLSGGIDSALTAAIAAEALGPDQLLGIAMPSRYSSQHSRDDARALAEALGMGFREIPIDSMFQAHLDALRPPLEALGEAPENDTTFENIQARIRGIVLMSISNRLGHLLLTTGNKSEIAVGYCTLYGDMAGGLAVISDLPKTFVYEVAAEVNRRAGRFVIPESTMTKAPSAELRPDQTDQDSLPPYEVLDALLELLVEEHLSSEEVVDRGYDAETVQRIARLVRNNEYKRRQMPPGLIVTRKAFGPGRRYPIAQRFSP